MSDAIAKRSLCTIAMRGRCAMGKAPPCPRGHALAIGDAPKDLPKGRSQKPPHPESIAIQGFENHRKIFIYL
ncbi:MAG: hypothetical protein KME30_15830 [Iphinoe sp. HA4291-MV1]|nr:hypothetical protein [Iphinoe sp. HA4291-MV1]